MPNEYRNFLALSYEKLEELNLAAKADRRDRVSPDLIREKRLKYLTDRRDIKAVTVLFSDLEGRLHLLDYDKKFLLGAYDNLTFDGSSIRGFTAQKESDLRLGIDWGAFYWVPADVFGSRQSSRLRLRHRQRRLPLRRRHPRRPQGVLRLGSTTKRTTPSTPPTKSKASSSPAAMPSSIIHETGKFEFVSSGGYYPRPAARSLAPVHRHFRRSPARHGLPE